MGVKRWKFLDTNRELRAVTSARVIDLAGRLQVKLKMGDNPLLTTSMQQLDKCQEALESIAPRGSSAAVAQIHFDAAFILYLRAADLHESASMMPAILGTVRENLPPGDLRRVAVEDIANGAAAKSIRGDTPLTESDRETVLDALAAANQTRIDKSLRIRSFVRIVSVVGLLLTLVAIGVAILTWRNPGQVPLCFVPRNEQGKYYTVCPLNAYPGGDPAAPAWLAAGPADYLVVEIIGLVSAGLAAATALRQMRGSPTPYNVSLVLAGLKLPTGALTAPAGLLFIHGGFVPGMPALYSSAQIIAWAIVFGYAQQILTRLVDNQAKSLLGHSKDAHKSEDESAALA
ncbi:hypothetical protein ACH4TP_05495 [Streptomyces sp. NPDC021012]|uniref:hypothetical protein n=1 Tax=Streptomyces sp. NPDC021012 TaxID=3365107 RepID=UPI00379784CB